MSRWFPVAVFSGLNAVDAWLTKSILGKGGWELNPLTILHGSNVAVKVIIAILFGFLLLGLKRGRRILITLNWCMLLIVAWNFLVWTT